jgi:glycolate oxidase FAD binding subunit
VCPPDAEQALARMIERLCQAQPDATPLRIVGGDTKGFYGRTPAGSRFSVADYRGVVSYEPTELVVTARAGTPLRHLEALMAQRGQMFGFEPPHFGRDATIGGAVATGLSGPRRPYGGSVRDAVLGVRCLTAAGDVLRFGGQVMKNVAGFDLSRLMCGALGTLAILLEVSLKVLPRPRRELTLAAQMDPERAIALMNRWSGSPLPLSGAAWDGASLRVRLSGDAGAVDEARAAMGPLYEVPETGFWEDLREQRLAFFRDPRPLWRLSLPPATPALPGDWLIDWGGAGRWLKSDAAAPEVQGLAARHRGYAVLFRGGDHQGEVFPRLSTGLEALHARIKKAFDPRGILNPGRLYQDL